MIVEGLTDSIVQTIYSAKFKRRKFCRILEEDDIESIRCELIAELAEADAVIYNELYSEYESEFREEQVVETEVIINDVGINFSTLLKTSVSPAYFAILQRDDFTCYYCTKQFGIDTMNLVIDHVYPLAKGGNNKAFNLITACRKCNSKKSDTMIPFNEIEAIWNRNRILNEKYALPVVEIGDYFASRNKARTVGSYNAPGLTETPLLRS